MNKIIIEGYWSNSAMNGAVLNVGGVCRTICCGAHLGCWPVIKEVVSYEKDVAFQGERD